jgi:predicted peptidase
MGGFATWQWALKYPEQFAAIAPVCGGGDTHYAKYYKDIPIWAFHGEADSTVPAQRSIEMVEAINACGGRARITIYPGVGHNSWDNAYSDEELYKWMLLNRKKNKK